MNYLRNILLVITMAVLAAGTAFAGTNVNSDITGAAHWTKANSPYHLKQMIHVKNGATLTIDAGTVVASLVKDQGSLAVCRGAKIYVNGTKNDPVIMTSAEDVNEWTGSICTHEFNQDPCHPNQWLVNSITRMGNPKSGKWLARCNDWGNLTILGQGYISAAKYGGLPVGTNTPCPNANNIKQMEGLTAAYPGDPNVMYGGGNDDDDSGSIHYLSLRYGGKVIGFANELNGLSLGGLGRATDIDHVEVMNNVDDGIEIWGGTVNLKYINVWNIGDDNFDCDEGWRGKAQFGLLVQGYSVNAAQGSGVGDNVFEIDGAEDSNAQPMTTSTIYNFTCVGQPHPTKGGDQGVALRDNAHVQFRNCIFMDLGERLIKNDNTDGDGGSGYGYAGTLSWPATWTTAYTFNEPGNLCGFNPALLYTVQTSGTLNEMTDCVFFRNLFASNAYADSVVSGVTYAGSDTLGVTVAGGSAPLMHNVVAAYNPADVNANMPIQKLIRGPGVSVSGGLTMYPVLYINPCAANDAVTSYATAPTNDSFFKPANYRGAFSDNKNWLQGWTAVDAYRMTDTSMNVADGDLNDDGVIDFSDFADFSGGWLQVN